MANQITKIYELKTLGYDELIRQLTAVEKSFLNISDLKKKLNQQKYTTTDQDELAKVNTELDKARLLAKQLQLQKLELANASKALANANAAETASHKAITSATNAEVGSYNDLLRKQKELYAQLKNANPNSSINGVSFDQAVLEYKKLAAAEQAFRRQFQADALLIGEYTKGIVQAFQQLGLGDLLGSQTQKVKQRLAELHTEFERLTRELRSLQTAGLPLDNVEKQLIDNRNEAAQLNAQLKILQTNMSGVGSIGDQVVSGLSRGFNNLKNQLGQMVIQFVGFYAVFNEVRNAVKRNAELSDAFANLQIRIRGTSDDVKDLFEQIKQLDTRTSLASLVDIANIVSKKGVAKDEIVPLTKALDDLFVVIGKEIGDPAEATASIIKLISIFNKDGKVTSERVNEIGTSIFKLTTSGVATGRFLIDFAERVGAIRGITGLTLPPILGMGAALEQLGQHVEVAGTASIQLTTKLFSNVPKFAAAAKLSVEEFRRLLQDNPFDALVATAEGLANLSTDEIATNFEEVVTAFGDVQITGARIKAVLGEIATNGKLVQDKMAAAAVTTTDYGQAIAGTELKQKTFAATLDRIKKQFETFGASDTVRGIMIGVATAISFLIGILPTLLGLLGLLAVAWTVQNAQLLILRAQMLAYNLSLGILYITQGTLYILQGLYIVGMYALRAAWAAAIIVARVFNSVISATPFGIIITGLVTLGIALDSWGQKLDKSVDKLKNLNKAKQDAIKQEKISQEVQQKSIEIIGDNISKLEALVTVVTKQGISYDVSRKALDELIGMHSQFSTALQGNVIDMEKVKQVMGEVRDQIRLNANAQAASGLSADKYKSYLEIVSARQKLERFGATYNRESSGTFEATDFFQEEFKGGLLSAVFSEARFKGVFDKAYFDRLKSIEEKRLKDYMDYNQFSANLQAQVISETAKQEKLAKAAEEKTIEQLRQEALNQKLTIEELERIINGIDKQRKTLKEGDPKLDDLAKLRDKFQARLDALNNKKDKVARGRVYRGARVSGEAVDALNEIEARMRLELAAEEERYARLQIVRTGGDEKLHEASYEEELVYLRRIKRINQQGLQDKIDYLNSRGKLNAKEEEQLATFKENLAKIELKYVKDFKNLSERQFNIEADVLKDKLERDISILQEAQERLELDINVSETDKAEAAKRTNDGIIILTTNFYRQLDILAQRYSISNQNIEDKKQKAIADLVKKGLRNILDITKAIYKDIELASETNAASYKKIYSDKIFEILNSGLPPVKRDALIEKLKREQEILLDHLAVATAKIRLDQLKKDAADGKALMKDLDEAQVAYTNALLKLKKNIESTPTAIKNIREGLQGIGQTIAKYFNLPAEQGNLLTEGIVASFQIAETALNNYFDTEANRIQKSLEINERRLEIELQQKKDRAQSTAEEISLEKQYAEQKLQLQKDAFEKNKKLQVSQLTINFAAQLSNIALAAAQNPTNAYTYGAAGIAQYAVQAGLAAAIYLLNLGNINSQTFEQGGSLGGITKGKRHSQGGSKFMFKGRVYEDEVGELNIIRTRDVNPNKVYSISGTQAQIASKLNVLGGGIEFAPGAKKFESGGILGSSYLIPKYIPSTNRDNDLLMTILELANAQSKRIDRIEVYQVTNTITKAQQKQVKQQSVGTF